VTTSAPHDNPRDNLRDNLKPLRNNGMTTVTTSPDLWECGVCAYVNVDDVDVIGCHVVTTPTATAENGVTTGMTSRDDPAAAYRDARARRAAYAAWEASGANIDDLPAGLLSACLHAAMTRPGKPGPRW
jgi:hypothetical protein